MTTERVDREFSELLDAAAPEMSVGWEARASEAATRQIRSNIVPTLFGGALVVLALALLPFSPPMMSGSVGIASAAQQALAVEAAEPSTLIAFSRTTKRESLGEALTPYATRAVKFVREHHPNDPEMLIAAGLLTRDVKEALTVLKLAVDKGGSGAAWAAYANTVVEAGPPYARLATWSADPTNPDDIARTRTELAQAKIPDKLLEKDAAPILAVLKQWEKVEPDNGMPVAFEAYYRYGLHRDREALERWEAAARRHKTISHQWELLAYTSHLLMEMGMPPGDAVTLSINTSVPSPLAWLRQCARIGLYEGRLARLEGRSDDAIRWWEATIYFGRNMQASADSLIQYLVGIAIEGIGASPIWIWHPDNMTGIPGGPLYEGRLYWGKQHEFFVAHVGETADREVRNSLARAKARSMLAREYVVRLSQGDEMFPSMLLRGFGGLALFMLCASLAVFASVSSWARSKADQATSLGWAARLVIVIVALLPGVSAFAFAHTLVSIHPALFEVALAVSLILLLLLPLVTAFHSRVGQVRLWTTWRGNLRRVLPLAMVICAILTLAVRVMAPIAELRWARDLMSKPEMARVISDLGSRWTKPTIPPDAWRNQYPPEVERPRRRR